MKTYLIDYCSASPSTIESVISYAFPYATVVCVDRNEDCFEAHVYGADNLDELDDVLARFVWVDPVDKWWGN